MISHKHKCIFIHIPKCAGTSIESALGHLDNHIGRGGQDHRNIRMIESLEISLDILSSRENIREIAQRLRYKYSSVLNPNNKLTVTKKQYHSYFKFTVIRNPWARAFSWYKNVMRDEIHKKNHGITKDLSLNEFLRLYAGKGMLMPQTYWLKNFHGDISLDYIINFEDLATEFSKVTKLMNISNITLPHEIKGQTNNFQKEYDSDSRTIIERVYKEEIEMFNYTFPS